MKRRVRDINIFNLSMMDVISGAMGAFLIIMVVLARYYKSDPTTSPSVRAMAEELADVRRRMEAIDQAMQAGVAPEDLRRQLAEALYKLSQAEARLNDLKARLDQAAAQIDRLDRLANQLQAERDQARGQAAAAQQQVNQLQAERDQAQSRTQELDRQLEEAQKRTQQLELRRPFGVQTWWSGCQSVDVDLYVHDQTTRTDDGAQMPPAAAGEQDVFWPGDTFVDNNGRDSYDGGSDTWTVRDAPLGARFAVYLKIAGTGTAARPDAVCMTTTALFYDGIVKVFDSPVLTLADPVRLLGFITMNEEGKPVYAGAAEPNRRIE